MLLSDVDQESSPEKRRKTLSSVALGQPFYAEHAEAQDTEALNLKNEALELQQRGEYSHRSFHTVCLSRNTERLPKVTEILLKFLAQAKDAGQVKSDFAATSIQLNKNYGQILF